MEGKDTAAVADQRPSQAAQAELDLAGRSAWPARDRRASSGDRFFEHAPAGIQELDAEGRFLRVNSAFSRMTGYPSEELVGRSIADIADRATDPDCLERLQDLVRRGAGVVRFDLGYVRRDGSLLQGRVTARVIAADSRHPASVIMLVEDASASGDTSAENEAGGAAARIDAVETVAEAVAHARDAAYEKGIDIAYAYAPVPVWVQADQAELRRAVDQLLAGAVGSTPLGSVAVRCTARDGEALLEVMEVRDPGATGADLGVVFGGSEAVAHGESGRVKARSLDAMQALVRAQHGNVGVTSSPETGNRITVRLPLARV